MRLENDLVMCEMEVKPESDSDGMTCCVVYEGELRFRIFLR